MKRLHLYSRRFAALACAIGLAACGGGGTATITIGGSISGLTSSGFLLSNGVSTVSPPVNAVSYTLPGSISEGASYSVVVLTQPTGLTCTVVNNVGVAGKTNVTNANITCVQSSFNLGGVIAGLTADGLVLANGSATVSPARNATAFTFPTKVTTGTTYGVTVLTQPAGLTCSVANGAAVVGTSDVTNVQVSCAAN